MNSQPSSIGQAILLATAVGGTLDISDAFIFSELHSHTAPATILKGIATGVFGMHAISGGPQYVVYGLLLHFLVAFIWVSIFASLTELYRSVTRRPFAVGATYGVFVYLAMRYVVLPLSRVPRGGHSSVAGIVNGVLALVFCFGIPVAWIFRSRGFGRR